MPIHELVDNLSIPIKGVIRLGVKKETAKGAEYPDTVEYFVLKDAPDVKAYYGDEPKFLDIVFPGDDIDAVLPTWFKYWTASVKQGNVVKKGELVCKGPGPMEGEPGEAIWYDRKRAPSEFTQGVPQELINPNGTIKRPCWGKHCVDAVDARGNPKCKQTMQVFCSLPLVSLGDIYMITTSSWKSMRNFHTLLRHQQRVYGPKYIVNNYYRIYREEEKIPYKDKNGVEKESRQFIMMLKDLNKEAFESEHRARLDEVMKKVNVGTFSRYLTAGEVEAAAATLPMEDLYPCIEASKELSPLEKSRLILEDPDFIAAIEVLETLTGSKFSEKGRLKAIRDKESTENQKEAVLRAIADKVANAQIVVTPSPEPAPEDTIVQEIADEVDKVDADYTVDPEVEVNIEEA